MADIGLKSEMFMSDHTEPWSARAMVLPPDGSQAKLSARWLCTQAGGRLEFCKSGELDSAVSPGLWS